LNRRRTHPFPPWLKKRIPASATIEHVRQALRGLELSTVCQSARCPNLCECFARSTATFMILGNICTRECTFCAVTHGAPPPPDPDEPRRVAEAAALLGLRHVVVTSVTRDDLADGGAEQFRNTILALRARLDGTVEVLTPDFKGDAEAIERVASAPPDVYNHNVETVPRQYSKVRPSAGYARSLGLLEHVKARFPDVTTKSGIMVGLGETREEVGQVLRDLRAAGCEMVTIGQYLQPTPEHVPVHSFVPPEVFAEYEQEARALGFAGVASGPFVRSSYHADESFEGARSAQGDMRPVGDGESGDEPGD